MSKAQGIAQSANQGQFKNRLINSDMQIDQRNAGASVTASTAGVYYAVDRTFFYKDSSATFTVQQSSVAPVGFNKSLLTTVTSPVSSGAGNAVVVSQNIEGLNVGDLGFGTASASTVTLSFWVRSSLTGTYCVALRNSAFNRSYVSEYSISSANTWEYKTITIAGDTTGTWLSDNSTGIRVAFDLGSGSNGNATANTWTASAGLRTTNQVNFANTSGATFYITGVQLEKGSTATSFDYRPYGTELALCQRYYWKTNTNMGFAQTGNITGGGVVRNPVTMRASPTIDSGAIFQVSGGSAGTVGLLNGTGYAVSPDGVVPYNIPNNWTINTGVQFIGAFTAEL
jgi:hypothetical protein